MFVGKTSSLTSSCTSLGAPGSGRGFEVITGLKPLSTPRNEHKTALWKPGPGMSFDRMAELNAFVFALIFVQLQL